MSTDVGNTAQIQPRDASIRKGSLVMEEVLRTSGFDVGEACVGLTAAGRCAEVSRATAFCWKHAYTC